MLSATGLMPGCGCSSSPESARALCFDVIRLRGVHAITWRERHHGLVAIPCCGSSSTLVDVLLLLVNCGSIAARPSRGKPSIADEVAQLRVGHRVDQGRRTAVYERLVILVAVRHVLVRVAYPQLHARVRLWQWLPRAA